MLPLASREATIRSAMRYRRARIRKATVAGLAGAAGLFHARMFLRSLASRHARRIAGTSVSDFLDDIIGAPLRKDSTARSSPIIPKQI